MCGRVNVSDLEGLDELIASIAERPCEPEAHARVSRWNVAPSRVLDVVTTDSATADPATVSMQWGIDAPWSNQQDSYARPLINARSESVFDKPSFSRHARARRCILPINGFYEWQRSAKQRNAFYIHPRQGPGLLVAGIWAEPDDKAQALPSLCLLTRAADEHISEIHDRMPMMLAPDAARQWIQDDNTCQQLLEQPSVIELAVTRVGDFVNNAGNEGPECVAPPRNLSLF